MNFFCLYNISLKKICIIFTSLIAVILSGCDSPEKRQFMTGCKFATRNGSVCACTWEKMSAIYPPKLLKAIGDQQIAAPSDFQKNMRTSLEQCIREE